MDVSATVDVVEDTMSTIDSSPLCGSEVDKRFEAPDYSDGHALARDFIRQTVQYARRYARHSS